MYRLQTPLRIIVPSISRPHLNRSFYNKSAKFVNVGPSGSQVVNEIEIRIGDPHEAFVLVPTHVGYMFRDGADCRNDSSSSQTLQEYPLVFHHDTRHFESDITGSPKLIIPQDLPRQSNTNTSPATLYIFGVMHTITLDGTFDAEFAKHSKATLDELGSVLDELKDR